MARITDVLSCLIAVALAVLGAGRITPMLEAFRGEDGRLNAAGLRRAVAQEPPFGGTDLVTVLLIGADQRPRDTGRSDTLIALFLNPQSHQLALLGLPRDLYVTIPRHGKGKINHAYAYGGPELTRRAVEGLLDLSIDYHAVVFFDGFVQAVDALGGVRIDVPDVEGEGRGMNYDDNAGNLHVHLTPGPQLLDGQDALGFVRYRKSNTPGLGDGDFARSGRQQQFLKALAEQHIKPSSLPGLLAAARVVAENVETDLSPAEITDLVRALHACDSSVMLTATVPLRASNWHGGGTYYAYADERKLGPTLSDIRWHLNAGATRRASVQTLNACGISGRAAEVKARLVAKGFTSAGSGNADDFALKRTVIEHAPGHEKAARLVARTLGCGRMRAMTDAASDDGPDIRVYVGRDYRPSDSG